MGELQPFTGTTKNKHEKREFRCLILKCTYRVTDTGVFVQTTLFGPISAMSQTSIRRRAETEVEPREDCFRLERSSMASQHWPSIHVIEDKASRKIALEGGLQVRLQYESGYYERRMPNLDNSSQSTTTRLSFAANSRQRPKPCLDCQ